MDIVAAFFSSELPEHVSTAYGVRIDLTHHWVGLAAVIIFSLAYTLVLMEEKLHLRKSKPVLMAAALIWTLVAITYSFKEIPQVVEEGLKHNFLEYAELFFFLLVAMTYINAMVERGVFDALKSRMVAKGLTYRSLFWITGTLAFFISPIADNLTTALILCAVIMAVANDKPGFISISCINIVIAANAGGAFSPFGDITTLMVWQKGVIQFWDFFALFVPCVINYLVPALIMQYALPRGRPKGQAKDCAIVKYGGLVIVALFLLTIATTVSLHTLLHLPPVFGMMTGLAYLKLYGYYLQRKSKHWSHHKENPPSSAENPYQFDVFEKIAQAEWDTLFFFYGVILAVGGLGFMGYLELVSAYMYGELGTTTANVLVGLLSAVVDNIPVMFAVLTMQPDMSHMQWLLVTLTAGVGGSLLSVGSAAGVALMGQARGYYTFSSHLKWTPVIALGYGASIGVHIWLNG